MVIPKIIHSYWEGNPSPLAEKCFELMRRLNPTWKVIIYNQNKLKEIGQTWDHTRQANSDKVRLWLLENEGGVWLDATCYSIKTVESWVNVNLDELQGFAAPFQSNVLESWALASPPGNSLLVEWRKEFNRAVAMGFDSYKEQVPDWLKKETKLYQELPYLTIHACYRVVSHDTNRHAKMIHSCDGPFKYLCDNDWNPPKGVKQICAKIPSNIPFIKMRAPERSMIEAMGKDCLLNNTITEHYEAPESETNTYIIVIVVAVVIFVILFIIYLFSRKRGKKRDK